MHCISKLKLFSFCSILALSQIFLFAQSGTMYGLYRQMTPPSVSLVSFDVNTGAVTPIGNQVLSTTINSTGVSLNPYNFSYNYQDGDSWLSLSLLDGSILSDVTVTFPNASGDFNNFRFNTADSIMYGIYSQVIYNQATGTYSGDMRLGSCDISTGNVSLISPNSIATSYTMSGSAIDPYLMVYYFITEGKLCGLDLYNGTIYSDPLISIPSGGNSFDNFAYSCADTTMYGLIMQNGVKCLGKIDATTGIVTPLPTLLNLDNYIMNAATIDPVNAVYYFESVVGNYITLIGLSLLDGSIVSSASIPNDFYFDMFKMDSDCFEAAAIRPNPSASIAIENDLDFSIFPNPVSDALKISCIDKIDQIEIFNLPGMSVGIYRPDQLEFSIQTAHLTPGFYTLKAQVGGQSVTKSFIKE